MGKSCAVTLVALVLLLATSGCGVSLRMHCADNSVRRVRRVEKIAVALKKATDALGTEPGEPEEFPSVVNVENINKAAKALLYDCQEMLAWLGALVKDVGAVPPKKKLKLDTPPEQDTQFEYIFKSGAKASERARKQGKWDNWLGKVIGWTVKGVWRIFPWWLRYPLLATLLVWLGSPLYINYQRARAARAAAQAEAAIARMQKSMEAEAFAEAVDAEHNPDLARVHEQQRKRERKTAARKVGMPT